MTSRTIAILQARVGSSRLPGKVLKPICGRPMLALQLERCLRAETFDGLVVATSTEDADTSIEELCKAEGVACFRGALDDVLDRYYQCAKQHGAQHVVRLTGDCPLMDPAVIDRVAGCYFEGGYDYASNGLRSTWPDGLDLEIISFDVLETAWREAELPSEREHVSPFIISHPERFRLGSAENETDYGRLRWTVDEPEDLAFVSAVFEALYPATPAFTMQDVLNLLSRQPSLGDLNVHIGRNEGYEASLAADAEYVVRKQSRENS